ncbi:cinnamycin family lantibiotic [Microseira sp. BLCC-F43]|jgi:hypothetical protein|uniref:cinnamycin family lantibiotic n=1 Tax=Microseira sp. BLCC-F43 TaxID=3153602 RepID=UPI0035BB96C0
MSNATLEKPSVAYEALEQLLHKAAFDAEFRSDLMANPELFGIVSELSLPASVAKQDETFVELLNDALGQLDIAAQCASTCSFGPVTLLCDGTTK